MCNQERKSLLQNLILLTIGIGLIIAFKNIMPSLLYFILSIIIFLNFIKLATLIQKYFDCINKDVMKKM